MATTKGALRAQLTAPAANGIRPQKVPGYNIALLPSLTNGPGGRAYKRRGMEFTIAALPEVRQLVVRGLVQRAYARAWGILGGIRAARYNFGRITQWVDLSMQMGIVDGYLVLTDRKNGQKGALAIEYGRQPYELEAPDGSMEEAGEMTGKFILHRGFGVRPGSLKGTGGGELE